MSADWSDLDMAVLGAGLPPVAESLITRAGQVRADAGQALSLLEIARSLAPDHPACLIALYRFHFYGNRLFDARRVALDAIRVAGSLLRLPEDWQAVPASAFVGELSPLPRFFLFSLKGYAYLSLRLGEIEEGRRVLRRLAELDPQNQTGHTLLMDVLARMGREDDDEDDLPASPFPDSRKPEGIAS